METGLSLVAAAILLWASAAKLIRAEDAAAAMRDHGVPAPLARPVVFAVAAAEAALALVLIAGLAPRAAGIALAALGLAFAAVLGLTWARRGSRVACACFGRLRERHAALLVARALLLAGLGAALAAGVPSPSGESLLAVAVAVLAVAVAALTALVLALYRQVGVLYQRLAPSSALEIAEEGPPVGAPAPDLGGLLREGAELVAFGAPGCRLCRDLAPALRAIERSGLAVRSVSEDADPQAFDRWGVPGTPFVAFVMDGVVRAKGLVNTMEQLESVVDAGLERSRHAVS